MTLQKVIGVYVCTICILLGSSMMSMDYCAFCWGSTEKSSDCFCNVFTHCYDVASCRDYWRYRTCWHSFFSYCFEFWRLRFITITKNVPVWFLTKENAADVSKSCDSVYKDSLCFHFHPALIKNDCLIAFDMIKSILNIHIIVIEFILSSKHL